LFFLAYLLDFQKGSNVMFRFKSIFVLAISIILLAACQPVPIEEAQTQLCADLTEFKAALGGVEALTADSTIEEAEAAIEIATDAWDDVANSALLMQEANYDNLDQAYEDLDDALRDINEGESIQDAAATIQTQIANVNAAYDEFYSLQCPE
jgi:hypothetical protein